MPRRTYTPAEVDTALLVLAMSGRNCYEASRRLKAEGVDVDRRTLNQWKNHTHAARYLEIEHDHAPKIEKQMVTTARAIVTAANQVTMAAIEKTREQVESGEIKDASTAARNLATVAGIQTDKALLLEGRPTEIRGAEDLPAALTRMAQRLNLPQSVDSTAEEYEPSAPELEG
jgi:hypothetical protein